MLTFIYNENFVPKKSFPGIENSLHSHLKMKPHIPQDGHHHISSHSHMATSHGINPIKHGSNFAVEGIHKKGI